MLNSLIAFWREDPVKAALEALHKFLEVEG